MSTGSGRWQLARDGLETGRSALQPGLERRQPRGHRAAHSETREFLRRVYAIDRNALTEEDQLNYELFRRQLQDEVDEHQFKAYLLPFITSGGIQNLDTMTNRLRLVTVQDYDDWLARLGKIDDVIDQTIDLAERGRKTGSCRRQSSCSGCRTRLRADCRVSRRQSVLQAIRELPESFLRPTGSGCARRQPTSSKNGAARLPRSSTSTSIRSTCRPRATASACRICRTATPGMNTRRVIHDDAHDAR